METTERALVLLYVEDDQASRELLQDSIRFRYPEMRLLVAKDGAEGIKLVKLDHPDIVVTDINMPLLNGIEMTKKIKSLQPSVEIIALTAHSDAELLLQAIEAGISNYILKPVDTKKLFRIIDKAITTIRSAQESVRQNSLIRDLNKELAYKTRELETANRELESFNYTLAHDLRAPMVSISGFSQLLLGQKTAQLDEAAKSFVETIYREISHMNTLVTSLLKFSVHSRKQVTKTMTNLTCIAQEISCCLQQQDPSRQVTFNIAEGLSAYADPDLLRIVLDNLLGNAWKYTSMKADAIIEIGTISNDDDLVYFVRDNGAGFDQGDADRLFTPFYRLECNAEIQGFGIGLATVCKIIQRHGGKIWASGEKGKGATFYFTL